MIILVTGGARSGKSSFAERYGAYLAAGKGSGIGRNERGSGQSDGHGGHDGYGKAAVRRRDNGTGLERVRRAFYLATSQVLDEEMRQRVELHRQRREQSDIVWETIEEPYELGSVLLRLAGRTAPVKAQEDVSESAQRDENMTEHVAVSALHSAIMTESALGSPAKDAVGSLKDGEDVPGGRIDGIFDSGSDGPVIVVDCLTLWLTNWLLRCEQDRDPLASVTSRIDELATRVLPSLRGDVILVTNEVGDGIVPENLLGRQFRDLAGMMNQRIAAVCDQVFLVTAGIPVELKRLAFSIPDGKGTWP